MPVDEDTVAVVVCVIVLEIVTEVVTVAVTVVEFELSSVPTRVFLGLRSA